MAIEIFTKEQFESALPIHNESGEELWAHLGMHQGEHIYLVPIDDRVGVFIRSSVKKDGYSADTGQDSIRAWLVTYKHDAKSNTYGWNNLGGKVNKYTTRVAGWEKRLINVIKELWGWRRKSGDCPTCNDPKSVFKVRKKGKNKGRVFAKCNKKECERVLNNWQWLT
jgi:ssDNA-binding Zn-finger/Zn-ribbon topoisomerase 1